MAEGVLETIWEYHRNNKIPYPEYLWDYVHYAVWFQFCSKSKYYERLGDEATSRPNRQYNYCLALYYERLAQGLLEKHVRSNRQPTETPSIWEFAEAVGYEPPAHEGGWSGWRSYKSRCAAKSAFLRGDLMEARRCLPSMRPPSQQEESVPSNLIPNYYVDEESNRLYELLEAAGFW